MGNKQSQQLNPEEIHWAVIKLNAQTKLPFFTSVFKYYLDAQIIKSQGYNIIPIFQSGEETIAVRVCEIQTGQPIHLKILDKLEFQELITIVDSIFQSQLNIQLAKQTSSTDTDENKCVLCFDNENQIVLSCGHPYCLICLDNWFINKNKDSCPICRKEIVKEENGQFYMPNDQEVLQSALSRLKQILIENDN